MMLNLSQTFNVMDRLTDPDELYRMARHAMGKRDQEAHPIQKIIHETVAYAAIDRAHHILDLREGV